MSKRNFKVKNEAATSAAKISQTKSSDGKSFKISQLLLVLGLPMLVYFQTANFDFSYHDDDVIILDGAKTLAAPFSFHDIFLTDAWLKDKQIELYRPLQSLSFWFDAHFFGQKPGGYHVHNLLLHLLNCFLVFQFLRILTSRATVAFLASLVWGLNFLNTHAVCWIPARGDLLLATWALTFLISFHKLLETKKLAWAGLNILAFAAALFSKENAVLLPVFGAILYFLKTEKPARMTRSDGPPVGKLVLPILGWAISAAIYFSMRNQSIGAAGQNLSFQSFLKNARVLPEELAKWFFPLKFSVMAGFDWMLLGLGLAVLAGLFFFSKKFLSKNPASRRLVFFAVALVLLPLLPSMFYTPQFVSYGYDYLDHRMYFPSVGLVLLFGLLVSEINFFKKSNVGVAVLAAYFGIFAFFHSKNYKNYDNYYQNAMATNPKSGLALTNYGILKRKAGLRDEAEKLFEKAMLVAPNYDFLQAEYAVLQNEKGNYQKALEFTTRLLDSPSRLAKDRDVLLVHRGFAKAKMGRQAEAIVDFEAAIAANPNRPQYFQNLGSCFEDLNRSAEAIEAYSKAIKLDPNFAQSLFRRGFQYGKMAQPTLALADFDRAISIEPGRGEFYYFRAMAYKDLNDREKYCENMRKAAAMNVKEAVEPAKNFCN